MPIVQISHTSEPDFSKTFKGNFVLLFPLKLLKDREVRILLLYYWQSSPLKLVFRGSWVSHNMVTDHWSCFIPDDQFTSSSIFGSQKDMEEQADAIIMYFGLNRTHWTALLWSPLRTQTFCPFSAFQMWIRPSVEPLITNCESGEKEASRGRFFELRWPVKDWSVAPL